MAVSNPLNVFKGPDALRQFFDPDEQPPVPLVELPDSLNPFRKDNVRIYAKLLTFLPAQNVKALPAVNMLLHDSSAANKSVVEVSSGSTVTSLAIANRVLYNNDDTIAYVSNKAAIDRVRELQFFGLKVMLYGGPTYTDTTDIRGPVEWARNLGKSSDKVVNLGQYDSVWNWKSHERWTGPQILKQLPEIDIFCMGMGSTGCVTGTGMYLKSQKSKVKVLGVCNVEADIVPGPRERPMHETSPFPWKEVVDETEIVSSKESYRLSMHLSREGIISGPSSGMNLGGLLQFIQAAKDKGTLSNYADPTTGEVSCVFVCCDLPQKHMDTYFQKLPDSEFKEIGNRELFDVDQHVYSFRWEADPEAIHPTDPEVMARLAKLTVAKGAVNGVNGPNDTSLSSSSAIRCIDLRSPEDFEESHVQGAFTSPLDGLTPKSTSVFEFGEPQILIDQSKKLKAKIEDAGVSKWLSAATNPLLVLDYDGNTSRVMAAALRARGFEAYSFKDGMSGLAKWLRSKKSA
ncbi:hypothetical protein LRP88_11117 [Fusarium phalaenopsidis]